jgi:predicted RNA binding protein YcfA (HicA-like mRNA interferase family)
VPKLPILSGNELITALKREGFEIVRQKGSHVALKKDAFRTVVPLHDELAKGTLMAIMRQCGLSKDDLINLLK